MKRSTAAFACDVWLFMKDTTVRMNRSLFHISGGVLMGMLGGTAVHAQIAPDSTLGGERSTIVPRASGGDAIAGGATRGSNLFHSFSDFNVGNGAQVYFANPIGIQNIFTRVTGGNVSSINGTLGVDGTANLFLLNPTGILFGQNAQLDVRGSFIGSTANGIRFGDQGEFSATNPQVPALLTVQPSALLFTQLNAGAIRLTGAKLEVPEDQTLAFLGGNVTLNQVTLTAPGGHIEMDAIKASGIVEIQPNIRFNIPANFPRADVTLQNSDVSVQSGNRGSVSIYAQALRLDASRIYAGISPGQGSPTSQAGDVVLDLTGALELNQQSKIFNTVFETPSFLSGTGNSGDIRIKAQTVSLAGGSYIVDSTGGQGNAGNIELNVHDRVSVDSSFIFSRVDIGGNGRSGDINITADNLTLKNSAQISAATFGNGNAGNITINAKTVELNGITPLSNRVNGILSTVESGAVGQGGNIEINANSISIANQSQLITNSIGIGDAGRITLDINNLAITGGSSITTTTEGIGNAGNVSITAHDHVLIEGTNKFASGISTSVSTNAIGEGGGITIDTGGLSLTNNAVIQSNIAGIGNAGTININTNNDLSMDNGSTISSEITSRGIGNGGVILVATRNLRLKNGSQIDSSVFGQGNAGNIRLRVQDSIQAEGYKLINQAFDNKGSSPVETKRFSGIFSSAEHDALDQSTVSNGGNVQIDAGSLTVTNGGRLLTNVFNGRGIGGNIVINARDSVVFDGGTPPLSGEVQVTGAVSGLFGQAGKGGNIEISANSIFIRRGSALVAGTAGQGDAGNIMLNARDQIVFDQSRIASFVGRTGIGRGGKIAMNAPSINLAQGSIISVSNFGRGEAGGIQVEAKTIRLDQSQISADTRSIDGGNLALRAEALILRRGSSLTTNATGNGGNISIAADAIVAVPGEATSIRANAVQGRGGNVRINTNSLLGLKPEVDITASSDLGVQGTVSIAQPEVQPTQGTIELPTTPIPGNQVSQTCPRDAKAARSLSSFVVSGRGSAPPNPINGLNGNAPVSQLATLDGSPANRSTVNPTSNPEPLLVEAQGWTRKRDGTVELVAHTPKITPSIVTACSTLTQSQATAQDDRLFIPR